MAMAFWLAAGVVGFAYLGYPLLMATYAIGRPRPVRPSAQLPRIDVLLVVHDVEALIEDKLRNLLRLDYPTRQLRINVVCDGCHDATESVARRLEHPRIRVFAHDRRRGKSACIADTLSSLDAELVLFTDVRQRVDADAARALAATLADPAVGAASGELVLEAGSAYGRGVDAYWRYEKLLRRLESASGSIVGVTGALYAARRNLLQAPPAGVVLDDMWIPLRIAELGHRVVFVPGALAYDQGAHGAASEEIRKRRTLAGNYQLLHRWPQLALPGAHPLALRLWGHKWLRLAVPWCLLAMLFCNASLVGDGRLFYATLLGLQVSAYLLALCGP